jgi:GTPase SAR1 family protein
MAKKPLQLDQQSTRGVTVDAFAEDLKPGFGRKLRHGFDLELSFWDFAGQLEYSAAHEFFMSTRQAVYVAVYSVLEDNDSIMQQLLYWLSVIPDLAASPHVRLMIVGTKIDLLPSSQLQAVLQSKRSVIRQVVEAKGLLHKMQPQDVLFVSALKSFAHDGHEPKMTWETCRRALKDRIYENCVSVFANNDAQQLQQLRYPKQCKEMSKLVAALLNDLRKKQTLPCCRLDDDAAVQVLGSIFEDKDRDRRKNYFRTDLVTMALEILNDLGIIVLYGRDSSLEGAPSVPSICLEPQFLPGIMSLLVDPQTFLPAVTTVDALMDLMEKNPDVSRISRSSPPELRLQLLELLQSVGIVRRNGSSQQLLIPLALRGRPVCWSQVIRGRVAAVLDGQRLGVSPTASVPAASFMKVMLNKCADTERMWGCAFAYDVGQPAAAGGEGSICMFVRLREDRRSVDVVAVMDEGSASQSLAQREVDSIAQLLGKDFSGASARMQLCPMCCSADMFVRSGAAHAFHVKEVAACGDLQCSRYHDVTASDVTHGKLTKLDMDALPLVYPSRFHELQLPWKRVASGGIISSTAVASRLSVDTMVELAAGQPDDGSCADATAAPPRPADVALPLSAASLPQSTHVLVTDSAPAPFPPSAHDAFHDGVFTDVSFFVLTGQVSAGDSVSAADAPEFTRLLSVCASQDCSCDIQLSSGQRKSLTFSFTVGQCLPNPFVGGLPIHSIFPADVGDRALQAQTPLLQRFCAHDNVLVVFGPIVSNPKPKFLVFPGSSANLQLCRLTPALCQNDLIAACCWSELQVRSRSLFCLAVMH